MTDFAALSLAPSLIESLRVQGITQPTAVQEKVIPLLLEKQPVFFESETGTGKTLAFLLPFLTLYGKAAACAAHPGLIIVTPTIELAAQIKAQLLTLKDENGNPFKSVLCVGGSSIKRQIEGLKEKPFAVIGTAARLIELVNLKKLKLQALQALVVDEADRQLSKEQSLLLKTLLAFVAPSVHIAACSATFDDVAKKRLTSLLAQYGGTFTPCLVTVRESAVTQHNIEHWALFSERKHKFDTLRALIHALGDAKLLIFTAPAYEVETLAQKLRYKHIEAYPLYKNVSSAERKQRLAQFKSGIIRVLVASDLSARGLDIPDVAYVIQLTLSSDKQTFIHRAGRTGRAGKKGINIVIGDEYELCILQKLEKKLNIAVQPKALFGGKIVTP
ncbi:MAG: DEAD/DEAH box helicase [Treponema sp.]